ncbi:MAG: hypothetical protein AB8G95_28900 [Anaerolineae bacterium]
MLVGAGCNSESTISTSTPKAQIDTIRPSFIERVNPLEHSQIDIDLFKLDQAAEYAEETLIELSPLSSNRDNVGYASRLCVQLNLGPLGEPNDNFKAEEIQKRASLKIDENPIDQIDYLSSEASLNIVYFSAGEFRYPGLTDICWVVDLEKGDHIARFEFIQTSGKIKRYTWAFSLE